MHGAEEDARPWSRPNVRGTHVFVCFLHGLLRGPILRGARRDGRGFEARFARTSTTGAVGRSGRKQKEALEGL